MTNRLVLIIGAGPTGLALALWLTRLGVAVRIIDKTDEPGTTSRALAVQVRTLDFHHQLGMADSLITGGVKMRALLPGGYVPSSFRSLLHCSSESLRFVAFSFGPPRKSASITDTAH